MGKWLVIILLGVCTGWGPAGARGESPGKQLVLVARADAAATTLDRAALRKLFLGLPDDTRMVPLINRCDATLYQVFLQKVMFMSERRYERQLLSLAFRTGSKRPDNVTVEQVLHESLLNTEGAVTFMWSSDVKAIDGLMVIQVLAEGLPP